MAQSFPRDICGDKLLTIGACRIIEVLTIIKLCILNKTIYILLYSKLATNMTISSKPPKGEQVCYNSYQGYYIILYYV